MDFLHSGYWSPHLADLGGYCSPHLADLADFVPGYMFIYIIFKGVNC